MATYTNNLNLEKPDKTEQYSIDVFNANADKIDNFAGLTPPNALTADKLTTGANINGVLFDGSNDVISGLGLYSATQTYNSTNIVYDYINFELKLFKSKKDENIGNPLSSTEFWEEVSLGGSGHDLFDIVLKDKVLTFAESSGFAQLGTYVYKSAIAGSRYGYPAFYEQCLKEYQEAGADGIYLKHSNGHVFYDIANKSQVDAVYNSSPLLGKAPDRELVERIGKIILAHPEVIGIHDLMVHDYGPGRLIVSVHGEVSGAEDIYKLHDVIDRIENELDEKLGCESIIHMDPIDPNDKRIAEMREAVAAIARAISPELTIHDFRMVPGESHTNLIFDLVLPHRFELSGEEACRRISEAVAACWPNYYCVIKAEQSYI